MRKKRMAIPSYSGYYEISEDGSIYSVLRTVKYSKGERKIWPRVLKQRKNNRGYIEVRLSKEGITSTKFVHRLLAEVFIPNPENKPFVNHKNGNKIDNSLDNLEWVTHSENISHAYAQGKCPRKSIKVFDILSGKHYESIKRAAEDLGISRSSCNDYLKGKRRHPTKSHNIALTILQLPQ